MTSALSSIDELGTNVVYDPASTCGWADLNETKFLRRVLARLREIMGPAFAEHTFVILSSPDGSVSPRSRFDGSSKKVLIFISDETSSVPLDLQSHYFAIFKAYLPHDVPGTNIFPFSLGYVRDVPAYPVRRSRDRPINVFFSGNLGLSRMGLYRALHPVYRRLPESLCRLAFEHPAVLGGRLLPRDLSRALPNSSVRFTGGFKQGLSAEQYGKQLADSRIVICPMGARSPETFRHVEAMRAGAVLVSEPLPDTRFYRGAPIVIVKDWRTGLDRIRELLDGGPALDKLQRNTVEWWETVCSEDATARYMAEQLETL